MDIVTIIASIFVGIAVLLGLAIWGIIIFWTVMYVLSFFDF